MWVAARRTTAAAWTTGKGRCSEAMRGGQIGVGVRGRLCPIHRETTLIGKGVLICRGADTKSR
jgi:hypothetical protein